MVIEARLSECFSCRVPANKQEILMCQSPLVFSLPISGMSSKIDLRSSSCIELKQKPPFGGSCEALSGGLEP